MFLIETVKRIFSDMPKAKEPEEGWDWFEDETDPTSRNYDPSADPADPLNPANSGNPVWDLLHD